MDRLRKLQMIELNMLKDLTSIFDKYGLRYYMLGGTLLGAVRHKGFIPWDDDVDIGMPRKDYERFLKIAKRFKGKYALSSRDIVNYRNTLYFVKIIDRRFVIDVDNDGKILKEHPWIDIFPLDGVPDGRIKYLFWKYKTLLLYRLYMFSRNDEVTDPEKIDKSLVKNKVKYIIMKSGLIKLLDKEMLYKGLDKHLKKYDFDKCGRVINFCGFWRFKEMFPKSVYDNVAEYVFEGLKLKGPADYDFVLSQMYGDYMTPPPDADKKHHNTIYESLRKVK